MSISGHKSERIKFNSTKEGEKTNDSNSEKKEQTFMTNISKKCSQHLSHAMHMSVCILS